MKTRSMADWLRRRRAREPELEGHPDFVFRLSAKIFSHGKRRCTGGNPQDSIRVLLAAGMGKTKSAAGTAALPRRLSPRELTSMHAKKTCFFR